MFASRKRKKTKTPLFGRAARKQCCQMALSGEAVVFPETAWSWGMSEQTRYGGLDVPLHKESYRAGSMQPNKALPTPKAGHVGGLTCAIFPKTFGSLPKFNVHHPRGNHVRVTKSRRKSMSEEHVVVHSDRCVPWLWGMLLPVTSPAPTSEKPESRAERRTVKTTSTATWVATTEAAF